MEKRDIVIEYISTLKMVKQTPFTHEKKDVKMSKSFSAALQTEFSK